MFSLPGWAQNPAWQPVADEPSELVTRADGSPRNEIRIYRYKPFYIRFANPRSKLQISLATALLPGVPLFAGYNQRIVWQLLEKSIPIEEVQFQPDMFWRITGLFSDTYSDIGMEHISNGQKGENSRSFFRLFLRLQSHKRFARWLLASQFRLMSNFGKGGGLEGYDRYTGLWQSVLDLGRLDESGRQQTFGVSIGIALGGDYGLDWRYGSQFVQLKFDISPVSDPFFLLLRAEWGYGETLKVYDRYHRSLQMGIEF